MATGCRRSYIRSVDPHIHEGLYTRMLLHNPGQSPVQGALPQRHQRGLGIRARVEVMGHAPRGDVR